MTLLFTLSENQSTVKSGKRLLAGIFYLSLFVSNPLQAGPWYSLEKKTNTADVIIEVSQPGRHQPFKLLKVLKGQHNAVPGQLQLDEMMLFSPQSSCWLTAHRQDSLRALVFYRFDQQQLLIPITGVENKDGFYTSLNPSYTELKRAIVASLSHKKPFPVRLLALQTERFCQGGNER